MITVRVYFIISAVASDYKNSRLDTISTTTPIYVKPKFLKDYEVVYKEIYKKDLNAFQRRTNYETFNRNNIKDKLIELRFDITTNKTKSYFINIRY